MRRRQRNGLLWERPTGVPHEGQSIYYEETPRPFVRKTIYLLSEKNGLRRGDHRTSIKRPTGLLWEDHRTSMRRHSPFFGKQCGCLLEEQLLEKQTIFFSGKATCFFLFRSYGVHIIFPILFFNEETTQPSLRRPIRSFSKSLWNS